MNNEGNFGGFSAGGFNGGNGSLEAQQSDTSQEVFVPPAQVTPVEKPEQELAGVEAETVTEASVVPGVSATEVRYEAPVASSFEEEFAAMTATAGGDKQTNNSVKESESGVYEQTEGQMLPNEQQEEKTSYVESLEEDRDALKEAHEKTPNNAKIKEYLDTIEKYIAKVREEMDEDITGIGDPGNRAERIEAMEYNTRHDRGLGHEVTVDSAGMVN